MALWPHFASIFQFFLLFTLGQQVAKDKQMSELEIKEICHQKRVIMVLIRCD